MLEVRNIEAFYGETQALFGASLSVGKAEVVALLGPNGAGKTTTIRSILGLTRPRSGAIRFDGKNWEYRQGLRWLPGDEVRDVACDKDGGAWFATRRQIAEHWLGRFG